MMKNINILKVFTPVITTLVILVGFLIAPATAYAGSTDHFIWHAGTTLGWCNESQGYVVMLSQNCDDIVWTFTRETTYGGFNAYEVSSNGLCATVATSNGPHYITNNIVMEGCQDASNQQFINPTNPGNLDSVWGGEHDGCGTQGAPTVYDDDYAGLTPIYGVSVEPCAIDTPGWNIPLD